MGAGRATGNRHLRERARVSSTTTTAAMVIMSVLVAAGILLSAQAGAQDVDTLGANQYQYQYDAAAQTPSVIVEDCASVEVEVGYYLYYSPTEPNYFCVHPDTQSPQPIVGGGAQVPSTCALAPDQRIYCSPYGELTAATLQELYAQGQLPSL